MSPRSPFPGSVMPLGTLRKNLRLFGVFRKVLHNRAAAHGAAITKIVGLVALSIFTGSPSQSVSLQELQSQPLVVDRNWRCCAVGRDQNGEECLSSCRISAMAYRR
jgi:hypothetical protein